MLLKYLSCFFISMVPLVELRGAIPLGVSMGLPPLAVLINYLRFLPFSLLLF